MTFDHITISSEIKNDEKSYATLEAMLVNKEGAFQLHDQHRALYSLKNIGTDRALKIMFKGLDDPSPLLKHEVAYTIGQLKNPVAIEVLSKVLSDTTEDPMVRHEAGEALGAIGHTDALPVLKAFIQDENDLVRETCHIAFDRIQYIAAHNGTLPSSPYACTDPAPSLHHDKTIPELKQILLDHSISLFLRYGAMFTLRDRGTEECIHALGEGFKDKSALFRHEIAYVFGQMQSPHSVPFLIQQLQDPEEKGIVRHECAEALGSIATEECEAVLKTYMEDQEQVVKDSCKVALDMLEYENNPDQFQFIE